MSTAVLGGLCLAPEALAHQDGCHAAHSCPSDHHTYVWYSGGTGYDCAQPGAPEYDPAADTTMITFDGRTYYCRVASAAPAPPPPADSDADGVPDGTDACPMGAAATLNGCPPPASPPLDSDGDGISDDSDGCPSAPAATDDGCQAPTRVYIGA